MYVQYREYVGFAKCMEEFRGKKLVMKETDGKAIAATIKVISNSNRDGIDIQNPWAEEISVQQGAGQIMFNCHADRGL